MVLHPELRARLQKLGVERSEPSAPKPEEKEKGGLDADVDSLLQQLEDLDTRACKLHKQDRQDHARWRKDDEKSQVPQEPAHPLSLGERRCKRDLKRTPSTANPGACVLPPLMKASASAPVLVLEKRTLKGGSIKDLHA
ncbi:unnamed protein product [Effrenium voratum]|nr:unnamed protein product [Effrenium voratum]